MSGHRKDVSVIHAVACPKCWAPEGMDCVRVSGIWAGTVASRFHAGRINAATERYVRRLNEERKGRA